MKNELVSFKTAELAREKGCSLSSGWYYDLESNLNKLRYGSRDSYGYQQFSKGLGLHTYNQALLQRWLREVHKINISFTFHQVNGSEITYDFCLHFKCGSQSKVSKWSQKYFKSYEEALEEGLSQALNLISL